MKIGIEHEIGVLDQKTALKKMTKNCSYMDSLNVYSEIAEGIEIAFDKEYYQTQYEIKFKPFDVTVENINLITNYLSNLYGDTDSIQNQGPDFVGTHIHIMNEYGSKSKGILQVIERLFKEMVDFWIEVYEDERIAKQIKRTELARLIRSNNLMKFFDRHIMSDQFSDIMEIVSSGSLTFQYQSVGNDKNKYSPVIWSEAKNGKPYSLELRYISNTYFLIVDGEKIKKLIEDCVSIVEAQTKKEGYDLVETENTIANIRKHYLSLTLLYNGLHTNLSIRNLEEVIQQFLPLVPVKGNEERLCLISENNMRLISSGEFLERSNEMRRRAENKGAPSDPFSDNNDHDNDYDDDNDYDGDID